MDTAINEGKTKKVFEIQPHGKLRRCRIQSKDDTTAGDGARHEIIEGKAAISTRMAVNTFELLDACGIPVAYESQDSETSFIAPLLRMILIEAVGRGEAHGSYLQRHRKTKKGYHFHRPAVELFLKTKDRRWGDQPLVCDDPLMEVGADGVYLHHAHEPYIRGHHFVRLTFAEAYPVQETEALIPVIERLTLAIYLILRRAWELVGKKHGKNINLVDFKCEFGIDSLGNVLLGDLIDGDSCRLLVDGVNKDKDPFRHGASVEQTRQDLAESAELSDTFRVVQEEIAEWAQDQFTFVQCSIPTFHLKKGLQTF